MTQVLAPPARHREAAAARAFLSSLHDPIAELAHEHGVIDFTVPSHGLILSDHLERLTLTIVGQLISVKAALVIFGRLRATLGGRIDAIQLAELEQGELMQIGLSGAKARAVHALGVEVASGRLNFDELEAMSDDQAQARLVELRGIGEWSAQMFLLRSMGRPDVFRLGIWVCVERWRCSTPCAACRPSLRPQRGRTTGAPTAPMPPSICGSITTPPRRSEPRSVCASWARTTGRELRGRRRSTPPAHRARRADAAVHFGDWLSSMLGAWSPEPTGPSLTRIQPAARRWSTVG